MLKQILSTLTDKNNKPSKTTLLSLVILALLFLSFYSNDQTATKKYEYHYTIWIGGEFVQTGHQTDAYFISGQMLQFINTNNKSIQVPISNVANIEENQAANKEKNIKYASVPTPPFIIFFLISAFFVHINRK